MDIVFDFPEKLFHCTFSPAVILLFYNSTVPAPISHTTLAALHIPPTWHCRISNSSINNAIQCAQQWSDIVYCVCWMFTFLPFSHAIWRFPLKTYAALCSNWTGWQWNKIYNMDSLINHAEVQFFVRLCVCVAFHLVCHTHTFARTHIQTRSLKWLSMTVLRGNHKQKQWAILVWCKMRTSHTIIICVYQ